MNFEELIRVYVPPTSQQLEESLENASITIDQPVGIGVRTNLSTTNSTATTSGSINDQIENKIREILNETSTKLNETKMEEKTMEPFESVSQLHDAFKLVRCLGIPAVRHISHCTKPGKECVVVVFDDNTKVITTPKGKDVFDLNVGVALAITEKMFGTKSQYHKFIREHSVEEQRRKREAERKDRKKVTKK